MRVGQEPLVSILYFLSGYPTWQSSEGWSGAPSRATDGRSSGNYWDGSCTHSGSTDYNMWKVDLIDKYEVNRVVIHNRVDCCSERIDGVQVCGCFKILKVRFIFFNSSFIQLQS